MNQLLIYFLSLSALSLHSALGVSTFVSGHGDIGIGFEGGALELHYHLGEDQPAILSGDINGPVSDQEFEPSEIVVLVGNPVIRPAAAAFDFLGVPVGGTIYLLPEDELDAGGAGVPFLGIGAEELVPSDWSGPLSLSLVSASGPGQFSLYDFDGVLEVFMSTADSLSGPLDINAGDHRHANWAFTAPGIYDLEFSVTGTLSSGQSLSDTATFRFQVVPEPSTGVLGLASLLCFLRRRA